MRVPQVQAMVLGRDSAHRVHVVSARKNVAADDEIGAGGRVTP